MVRKRSRASRKQQHYASDENDSDSDFAVEKTPAEPAPKKYSLRQRKRPLFTEDFDYDDDGDEIAPPKATSDDEDFNVEEELAAEKELELDEAANSEYVDKSTYINHYEPESEDIPEDTDELIDFEDMIRADIVVNKNRIDYDNIIQKTEIKVQPIAEETKTTKVKSTREKVTRERTSKKTLEDLHENMTKMPAKRGRKPKIRPPGEIDSSILEPETEVQEEEYEYEDKNDQDYNPEDDIDNGDDEPIYHTNYQPGFTENTSETTNVDNKPQDNTNIQENKPEEKNEEVQKLEPMQESEKLQENQIPRNELLQGDETVQNSENLAEKDKGENGTVEGNKTVLEPEVEQINETVPSQENEKILEPLPKDTNDFSQNDCNITVIKMSDHFPKEQINGTLSINDPNQIDVTQVERNSQAIFVDDDDVVLVDEGKKCEVIVLDD